jgi:hypothetical protein
MLNVRERGRLFERPETPRELHLRPRHIDILVNLARLRLAHAAQLAALDGGSEQNVGRELLALWEHGYVERLLGQLDSRFLYRGSLPICYGLTRKGARLLRKHGGQIGRRILDGIDKERDAKWRFIEHRVDISEFIVQLEVAARGREGVGVLHRGEILEDAPKTRRDRRVRLSAKLRIDGSFRTHSVDPDELFGLRFHESDEESYFMFERDRGEMPVRRHSRKDQTYFEKKMMVYYEANRAREHVRDLGIPNFRVATVTTTEDRVAQMIDAQIELTGGRGSNMFLFIDDAALQATNPLDAVWMTGKGERIRLTD